MDHVEDRVCTSGHSKEAGCYLCCDRCNYDGHSSEDVIARLMQWAVNHV